MHANAAGCSIKNGDISKLHNYANSELINMDFNENVYDVNFICDAKNQLLSELIIDLSNINDTYGQMNNEPLIAIENIHVNKKKDVVIMGKNQDTVKIVYGDIAYMFFKAKDFIEQLDSLPEILDMTVIGRANLNDYYGTITPQIFVDNWELKETTLFDF